MAGIQVRNMLCFSIGCEEDSQSFIPSESGGLSFCKLDGWGNHSKHIHAYFLGNGEILHMNVEHA